MLLTEFIVELTEIAVEEDRPVEVIATDPVTGEEYTPVISIYTAKDGRRLMTVC